MLQRPGSYVVLILFVGFALVVLGGLSRLSAHDRPSGPLHKSRSSVLARQGMAATSQPLATAVAIRVLQQGGNAIDAAIAANAVLGVVEPMSCGLGGDLFAIVWDAKSQKLYGLNASGRAPYAATRETFAAKGLKEIPAHGPLSWSVPGCVDGWDQLRQRFGTRPLAELLAPAIAYAEDGFPVSEIIADDWQSAAPELARIPTSAACFLPGGAEPEAGTVFRNPDLGRSLRAIAAGGRDAFYRGAIAEAIAAYSEEAGGLFALKDFADHTSTWVEPVSTNYRGYDVWELPPNGQGIAVLQMLNLLEPYDLKSLGPQSAETLHLQIEAKKLAYEDRATYYADPEFSKVPVARLISKAYAAERRSLDRSRAGQRPAGPGCAGRGRHDLHDRGRQGLQCREPDPEQLLRLRLVPRPRQARVPAPEPGLPLRARPAPRQPPRAAQAAVPHDHSRLRDQGGQALAQLRADGGRHAGPGACAGALQHDRLRHGRPGGRRRPPVPPLRLVRAHRHPRRGRRARSSSSRRSAPTSAARSRPRGIGSPRSAAATAATRRSASTPSRAS